MGKEDCILCLQPITNPVCEGCYEEEVDEFLKSMGFNKNARSVVLDEISKKMPQEGLNEEKCILCGEDYLSVCSYCYFNISMRALRELNFHEDFIEYFSMIFSYEG